MTPQTPPPASVDLLRRALALLRSGEWHAAHDLVQRDETPLAAWLHGLLHVQEGDLEDAEYWWGRAGRAFRSRGSFDEELARFEAGLAALAPQGAAPGQRIGGRTAHQIVADHYAASARGDLDAMMAEVSPEVRWTEMAGFPCAGTHVGPAQVVERVFQVLGRDWDGYRFELEALLDAGDAVVGVGHYRGRHRATGKAIDVRVAHVWRVQDGLVRSFEQFTDTLLVNQAMR